MTMNGAKLLFDDRIKPKNVLALNEKVAAIRRYEIEPVYKKVGRMFNCSPDQIKRIIKQKNEILAEWENRTKRSVKPTSHEIKTVKVSFLGKAVHEWIRRIMYYTDFNLNDTLIQTMAMEFSKVLKLVKFYPTKEWIANFRATYNLPDANTKTMSIGYQESHSVQIRDILRYVKEICAKDVAVVDDQSNSDSTATATVVVAEIKTESGNNNFREDVVMKIEKEDCEPSGSTMLQDPVDCKPSCSTMLHCSEVLEENLSSEMPMQIDSETTNYKPAQIQPQEINDQLDQIQPEVVPVPESEPEPEPEPEKIAIYSHAAAISCVKLLEDFALLKENFRLIGLIERLEEALNEKS